MPFLAPLIPAIVGGAATAGAGALAGKLFGGGSGVGSQASGIGDPNAINAAQGQIGSNTQQQQAFINALAAQNGIGNQSNVFNQMQGLSGLLGDQAQGLGPNPALAQLSQTTGQNTANQAALMARQRGIGNNPGLAARNIGQMGAAQQQQAVGQAATMRAQQQIAAQQALQNQQAMMGNMAGNQVGQHAGALQQLNQMGLQNQGQLLGLQGSLNSGMGGREQQFGQNIFGGAVNGLGAGITNLFAGNQSSPSINSIAAGIPSSQNFGSGINFGNIRAAHGGEIPEQSNTSSVHQYYKNMKAGGTVPGKAKVSGDSLKNDTVPAMLSPKEIVLPRSITLSDDAPDKAKAFVEAILNHKKGLKRS